MVEARCPVPARRPLRIVVAEDDDAMRALVRDALTADGYDVVDVATGPQLLDELARERGGAMAPALVVSDVRMPGLTGLEVLARIRASGSRVPVVLLTAFGDERTLASARELAALAVFSKPFDLDDLRTAVALLVPMLARER